MESKPRRSGGGKVKIALQLSQWIGKEFTKDS
jgi:hypothetical protein